MGLSKEQLALIRNHDILLEKIQEQKWMDLKRKFIEEFEMRHYKEAKKEEKILNKITNFFKK
jgi:hypothetical protein